MAVASGAAALALASSALAAASASFRFCSLTSWMRCRIQSSVSSTSSRSAFGGGGGLSASFSSAAGVLVAGGAFAGAGAGALGRLLKRYAAPANSGRFIELESRLQVEQWVRHGTSAPPAQCHTRARTHTHTHTRARTHTHTHARARKPYLPRTCMRGAILGGAGMFCIHFGMVGGVATRAAPASSFFPSPGSAPFSFPLDPSPRM